MVTELLAKETASSKFSLHLNSQEEKRSVRTFLLLHELLMSFLLFFTYIYACNKLNMFKANGLCNIFSVNSPFIVVISCTESNLLNNFTIVSSYLHAILMNNIPFVKYKNYVPQAWIWTVKFIKLERRKSFIIFPRLLSFSEKVSIKPHTGFSFTSFYF